MSQLKQLKSVRYINSSSEHNYIENELNMKA